MTRIHTFATASALALAVGPALAQDTIATDDYTLTRETVIEGLEHPWGMAFLPDGRFLVTERNAGTLRIGTAEGDLSDPIAEIDDLFRFEGETQRSQSGLFDVALHPDFAENGYVYVSYSRATERGAAVVVVRAALSQDDELGAFETVFEMKEADQDSSGLHFGGRMAVGLDGETLFLTIGERRNLERAQDAEDQAGSVLAMTLEGETLEGAPFIEDEDDADPYIYTMGNRNIQALAVHPFTGQLWAADHGPLGGDKIDLIVVGNNYGWPFVTGGVDYSGAPLGVGEQMEGMTPAVHVFDQTVAPSGLSFVPDGSSFPAWTDNLIVGGLVAQGVVRLTLDEDQVVGEEVIELGRRIRDVRIGPDGDLWLLTEHEDGEVIRLSVKD